MRAGQSHVRQGICCVLDAHDSIRTKAVFINKILVSMARLEQNPFIYPQLCGRSRTVRVFRSKRASEKTLTRAPSLHALKKLCCKLIDIHVPVGYFSYISGGKRCLFHILTCATHKKNNTYKARVGNCFS